ncbi:hypothetical protein ABEB36_003009 [Hypothenemus hampei]|uniref:Uncharacterized protein n=1 Tax=Hypothenemus hampei TaxID=57062 RepID=A0ABD1FAC6_HYPHA
MHAFDLRAGELYVAMKTVSGERSTFRKITMKFGSSRGNSFAANINKCKISWHRDPGALYTDAFTLDWGPLTHWSGKIIRGSFLRRGVPDEAIPVVINYLKQTKTSQQGKGYLILTHRRPHRVASTPSIRIWVKEILRDSGIYTE